MDDFRTCSRCVLDNSVQDISYDHNGVCNYCHAHDRIDEEHPNDERGRRQLEKNVAEIKKAGQNKKYDCIMGVSGGTDSTYLMYWAKKVGLRPLAVHFDNGWNSEIAVRNIKHATEKLDIDLETYVVDWEEFKKLQIAFLRASTPDSEGPTDMALRASLYRAAAAEGVKYILVGVNFRTEGKVPIFWSYVDGRYINDVRRKFTSIVKFKSYPNFTILDYLYYGYVKRIRQVRPFWHMDFHKPQVKELLQKELQWEYYGGHHYENHYTRFNQGYYLCKKFGFDKRKVEFSALIRSGQLTRTVALEKLNEEPYPLDLQREDVKFVRKKFGFTQDEFDEIMNAKPRTFLDYTSYYHWLQKYQPLFKLAFRFIYKSPPQIFHYLNSARDLNSETALPKARKNRVKVVDAPEMARAVYHEEAA